MRAADRSDDIVNAFAKALFAQQADREPLYERARVVELDLIDLTAPPAVEGPPRAARKRAPR
ncbi:MAG TPA: hypothetical protein VEQ15_00365 [Myxococcales bacterium]|nr:hypothetical protein [Myxococcales bacterium]